MKENFYQVDRISGSIKDGNTITECTKMIKAKNAITALKIFMNWVDDPTNEGLCFDRDVTIIRKGPGGKYLYAECLLDSNCHYLIIRKNNIPDPMQDFTAKSIFDLTL